MATVSCRVGARVIVGVGARVRAVIKASVTMILPLPVLLAVVNDHEASWPPTPVHLISPCAVSLLTAQEGASLTSAV